MSDIERGRYPKTQEVSNSPGKLYHYRKCRDWQPHD